jgi:hypothetical protein
MEESDERGRESVGVRLLRGETDLGTPSANLVAVVRETMQPEHVSLRLRHREDRVER